MQGYQHLVRPMPVKNVWVLCLVAPLSIHSQNDGPAYYSEAKAVDEVNQLPKCNQLLLGDRSACAPLHRTFSSPAAINCDKSEGGGRRDYSHFPNVNKKGGFYQFAGDYTLPAGAYKATHFLCRLSSTRHKNNHRISQRRKTKRRAVFHSEPKGALIQGKYSVRASGNEIRKDSREARHFQSATYPEEKEPQAKKEQPGRLHRQPVRRQRQQQERQRRQLARRGTGCHAEKNHHFDHASLSERKAENKKNLFKSRVKEEQPGNTCSRRLSSMRKQDLKLEAVGELGEFLAKGRATEAFFENEWKLIEESWKRAELFYKDAIEFSACGFRYSRQKSGRSVIQVVLPFWKVDLSGALEDMAKTALWRVFGAPASSATRPAQWKTGNGGNDTLVQIGYNPSWQRNTYTFGWNDTQITYSTGVDPTEAWPLERVGGNGTSLPVGHLMEVTSRNGGGKAFHDLSSRFYGHEVNVGDVGVSITHQFYNDTYNATPSNVVVRGQNYSVDIGADPPDTSYRVGVGKDKTTVTVLRDFDEKKTAFRGDFMDWVVSWDSDAADANSSSVSADAVVGSKNQEPFLATSVYRGAEEEYAQGDTQIQMKDLSMRMHWREEGLTGDITLGKIKYKFDMKDGFPNFTLTAP